MSTDTIDNPHAIQREIPRKETIVYWITTSIVAAIMLLSAGFFHFAPTGKEAFVHLGLPNYFRIELTVAKILGGLALLTPGLPNTIKQFAYFGCGLTILSAIIAHSASGDGIAHVIDPLVIFGILVVSYVCYRRRVAGVTA
jgi:DoxX-like protein